MSEIIDFLINSNPISATSVVCIIIMFFYNLMRSHEKRAKKMFEEQINKNDSNIDEINSMLSQIDDISKDISNNVRSLNLQIVNMQEKIKKIETSDIDNALELIYLKKDIEIIKDIIKKLS